ncbi:hypothetical protein [Nannocystis pusilla]|uniref:hypothetical protein n=1 Tax=Nannocystis pusilla TaxID=889268 RepID=UPI003DA2C9EB
MRARPAPGVLLVLAPLIPLLLAPVGCASSVCSKVRSDREAFTRRAVAPGPHLALAVPYATLSQSVQRSLTGLPQVRLPLPDLGPVDLGALAVAIRSVAFRPAPAGSVGARVTVALTSQGKPVTALEPRRRGRAAPRSAGRQRAPAPRRGRPARGEAEHAAG